MLINYVEAYEFAMIFETTAFPMAVFCPPCTDRALNEDFEL